MDIDSVHARIEHESAELRTLSAHHRLRTALVQWNEVGKKRYSLNLDIRWPRHQTLVSSLTSGCRSSPSALPRIMWRPWRSVATWYLWRSLDPVPVEY